MTSPAPSTSSHPCFERSRDNIPAWLSRLDKDDDMCLGSVVRLVRNLPDSPFPGWSTENSRREVFERLAGTLCEIDELGISDVSEFTEMCDLSFRERRIMLERKIITPCMAARQKGCYVAVNRQATVCVMINEEEHLVIHFMGRGSLAARNCKRAAAVASALDARFSFAKQEKLGYLVSNPQEVGDGMQFYQILHLPALALSGMIEPSSRAAEKLQCTLTPLFARDANDGEDDAHCFLLCASPAPLGTFAQQAQAILGLSHELERRELQMRYKLTQRVDSPLVDQICRSYAILSYAHLLSYKEMKMHISIMLLALSIGIITAYDSRSTQQAKNHIAADLCRLSPGCIGHSGRDDGGEGGSEAPESNNQTDSEEEDVHEVPEEAVRAVCIRATLGHPPLIISPIYSF